MTVSLDQAKSYAEQVADGKVPLHYDDRIRFGNAILKYLNQPTEEPDSEVWAEICKLRRHTNIVVFGIGDGEWGLVKKQHVTHERNAVHTPRQLLNELREMFPPSPKPTLESETAAREKAEEKLAACGEEIDRLREQLAELTGRKWKDWRTFANAIYSVQKRGDVFRIIYRYPDRLERRTSMCVGSGEPYETHSEAQGVLDAYAEEHGWEEVTEYK